ncbi:MAG: HNH endonuclease [Flavobacterium sp.]|nr:MAG: HNH endonuclease [Flavobacterium sp.]
MKCIFCYENSESSTSVEHIIPESLGNTQFILRRGIVCDKCNNYFSHTFEQGLLDLPFFKEIRHKLNAKSKKGKIPNGKGFVVDPSFGELEFHKDRGLEESIIVNEQVKLKDSGEIKVFVPVYSSPGSDNVFVSKFLGKMAIEALVIYAEWYKCKIEDIVNQKPYEALKNYVRRGKKGQFWQYYVRSLYHPDAGFQDPKTGDYFKVTSSFTFIYSGTSKVFFQYLIMGTELTIDLINDNTDDIQRWFVENNGKSPVLEQVLSFNYL